MRSLYDASLWPTLFFQTKYQAARSNLGMSYSVIDGLV